MVAVEVDGSTHFTQNQPCVPLGRTLWRWRLLAARGWRVVSVPYYRWARLQTLADKKQYLYLLLQVGTGLYCRLVLPAVLSSAAAQPLGAAVSSAARVARCPTLRCLSVPLSPALPQCESVWDCFSLDPKDRDAPFLPPANLAHLTPGGEPAAFCALECCACCFFNCNDLSWLQLRLPCYCIFAEVFPPRKCCCIVCRGV